MKMGYLLEVQKMIADTLAGLQPEAQAFIAQCKEEQDKLDALLGLIRLKEDVDVYRAKAQEEIDLLAKDLDARSAALDAREADLRLKEDAAAALSKTTADGGQALSDAQAAFLAAQNAWEVSKNAAIADLAAKQKKLDEQVAGWDQAYAGIAKREQAVKEKLAAMTKLAAA